MSNINPIETVQSLVREYLEDYEMIGETEDGRDACYTPNEKERVLIEDALQGFLADDRYTALLAQMQSQPSDEREAFEADALRRGWAPDELHRAISDGEYHRVVVQQMWLSWQAARALGPVKAQQEPVGYVSPVQLANLRAGRELSISLVAKSEADMQVGGDVPVYATPPAAHQGAQPAAPEGWQIVPVEPTPWMLLAVRRDTPAAAGWREKWKAMLAAAPSASAQPQEGSNNG